MKSLQNKAFIIGISLVLLCPISYRLADTFIPAINIPEKSQLEGRSLQTRPHLSREEVTSGQFQDNLEKYVADSFPERNETLLGNALLQRSIIELANTPFTYDVYPTFFSSKYLYCVSQNSTLQAPMTTSQSSYKNYKKGLKKLSDLMQEHPDINWSFFLVERSSISTQSPAFALTGNAVGYEAARKTAQDTLPEECKVFDGSHESLDDYYESFFTSDHHWRVVSAVKAYCEICDHYDKEPIRIKGFKQVHPNDFYGSNDRGGLCDKSSDAIIDVEYERNEDLAVEIDGNIESINSLTRGYSEEGFEKNGKFDRVYAGFFHDDFGLIEITNPNASDSILIVGDSYTNNMERLVAENYHKVYVLDPRHYKGTVEDFLTSHEIDDALFLGCAETLKNKDALKALS